MGWLFGYDTRSELIDHLTKDQDNSAAKWRTLAKYTSGNTLWVVHETTRKDTGQANRWIGCYLMQNGGNGHGWGYKDMEESMGPIEVSCPPKFLEMVPEVACQEWRDEVLKHWRRRREGNQVALGLVKGQAFKSRGSGNTFEFLCNQRGGYVVGILTAKDPRCTSILGVRYRVRKADIELVAVELVPEAQQEVT